MEGTPALGPAILPPIIPHKTRPNYALTQEVKPANDAVDGRWPQEQETSAAGSNEAKVQKRTTPNNSTATNNTTIPAPMATPEQVGRESVINKDGKDDDEANDDDVDNDDVQVGREVVSSGGDSPEEQEKEERRRTAHRVLLKQG